MKTPQKSKPKRVPKTGPKQSAGLLLYRARNGSTEVFLVHPGGPFWAKKDDGAWSIPKGEFGNDEDPLEAAKREFHEETGFAAWGDFQALEPVRQPSGKIVHAWAARSDVDASAVRSNTFTLEWPPGSGKMAEFPEIDRAEWFPLEAARRKLVKGQVAFVDQLDEKILSHQNS